MSIPSHPAFSRAAEISGLFPWPPKTSRTPQNYTFILFVRDAFGMQAGPFPANRTVTVQPPACLHPCTEASAIGELADCLACGERIPVPSFNEVVNSPREWWLFLRVRPGRRCLILRSNFFFVQAVSH